MLSILDQFDAGPVQAPSPTPCKKNYAALAPTHFPWIVNTVLYCIAKLKNVIILMLKFWLRLRLQQEK
jgi:hypothetical protein